MTAIRAIVTDVAVGLKNPDNIYVKSKSGRVYRLNPYFVKGKNVVAGKETIQNLVSRIREQGLIQLKYFTKVKT